MKIEPFNPVDYDCVPPGELRNGPNARAQKRFELIPFNKIAFDTTSAYLVKGLIPASASASFGAHRNAASPSSFSTC
jgi:hypothetical protein